MRTIKFILFFLPFIMKAQTVDLLNAINFHNTVRTYQSNPILAYDDGLSLSAEEWANVIINTGNFDIDPNLPNGMGQNLFSIEQQQAKHIVT